MVISTRGISLIKSFEGFRERPYKAIPTEEYLTIGYGHYGEDVKPEMIVSEVEAIEMLKRDLKKYEKYVNNVMEEKKLPFNQNMFDALVSFTYNCGRKNLLTLTQNRNMRQIGEALPKYNKAGGKVLKGLVRRRAAEKELYFAPVTK